LKFKKLAKFMSTKRGKLLHNINTIDFNVKPTKRAMLEYRIDIFIKMALDSPTNHQVMLNYEHLCDI
jgi:hypothetical protein